MTVPSLHWTIPALPDEEPDSVEGDPDAVALGPFVAVDASFDAAGEAAGFEEAATTSDVFSVVERSPHAIVEEVTAATGFPDSIVVMLRIIGSKAPLL